MFHTGNIELNLVDHMAPWWVGAGTKQELKCTSNSFCFVFGAHVGGAGTSNGDRTVLNHRGQGHLSEMLMPGVSLPEKLTLLLAATLTFCSLTKSS